MAKTDPELKADVDDVMRRLMFALTDDEPTFVVPGDAVVCGLLTLMCAVLAKAPESERAELLALCRQKLDEVEAGSFGRLG